MSEERAADDEVDERESRELVEKTIGGRYRITGYIGKGGMGLVFRAIHVELGVDRAIKILLSRYAASKDISDRLMQEAKLAVQLKHPNVVEVHDVARDGPAGRPYLVMDLLSGETLASYLERAGPLTLGDTADILMPIVRALTHVHAKGIFHRDLKPDNIFLHQTSEGRVPKILDFGIAKQPTGAMRSLTGSGQWLGSPGYTRPSSSSNAKQEADQFSLGVILYECLAGKHPFYSAHESLEPHEYFARASQTEKFAVRIERPDLPEGLEDVILRMLTLEENRNFRSMSEVEAALDGLLGRPSLVAPSRHDRRSDAAALAPTVKVESGAGKSSPWQADRSTDTASDGVVNSSGGENSGGGSVRSWRSWHATFPVLLTIIAAIAIAWVVRPGAPETGASPTPRGTAPASTNSDPTSHPPGELEIARPSPPQKQPPSAASETATDLPGSAGRLAAASPKRTHTPPLPRSVQSAAPVRAPAGVTLTSDAGPHNHDKLMDLAAKGVNKP